MNLEFPYQIVTFLDKEPKLNEPVYEGPGGWYPQIAIKRRFNLNETTEDEFIEKLKSFFDSYNLPEIHTGDLTKPESMPVQVVYVKNQEELKNLHTKILNEFAEEIVSKYPDREGNNYYPHVTAEYGGKFVIPVREFENKTFQPNNIWLLKDDGSGDSQAFAKIR